MQTALKMSSAGSVFRGTTIPPRISSLRARPVRAVSVIAEETSERLRLNNLSPAKGSRRQDKRKGRGYGGHQGGTCGFGNRGQKARANGGPRPGFEGGQTPLYRRVPKLKGIAGGMGAGLPDFVTVNVSDLAKSFQAGQEVSLDILKEKGLLNPTGREAGLPLKVLGNGELSFALNIKAASFSSSAMQKIQAAGGSAEVLPAKPTWTKAAHKAMVEEMAANGQDYKKVVAEKKAVRAEQKLQARKAATLARKEVALV